MKPTKKIWVFWIQKFRDAFEKSCITTRLHLSNEDFLYLNCDTAPIMIVVLNASQVLDQSNLEALIEISTLEFMNSNDEVLLFLVGPWLRDQVDVKQLFDAPIVSSIDTYFKSKVREDTELCGLDIFEETSDEGTIHCEFYRLKDQDLFFDQNLN